MNFVFRFQGVEFEWDSGKADSNLRKHDVKFEEAAEAFLIHFIKLVMPQSMNRNGASLSSAIRLHIVCC